MQIKYYNRLQSGVICVMLGVEVRDMEWQIVVALAIAIPVILFPAAFVWYLNIGGIMAVLRERNKARVKTHRYSAIQK